MYEWDSFWFKYQSDFTLDDDGTQSVNGNEPNACETIHSSKYVLVGFDDNRELGLFNNSGDTVYGKTLSVACPSPHNIVDVAVSPNESRTAAVITQRSDCNQLVILTAGAGLSDVASGVVQGEGAHDDAMYLTSVEFLDGEGTLVATGDQNGDVVIWRVVGSSIELVEKLTGHGHIGRMSYNSSENLLAVGGNGVTIYALP